MGIKKNRRNKINRYLTEKKSIKIRRKKELNEERKNKKKRQKKKKTKNYIIRKDRKSIKIFTVSGHVKHPRTIMILN